MKNKTSIEYYSALRYVGETWRDVRDRIMKRRKRLAVKNKKALTKKL